MKLISFIILSFFFVKGCGQQSKIDESALQIEYKAFSRSSFKQVIIDSKTIKQTTSRNLENSTSKKLSEKHWNTILKYLEELNWKEINTIKAPTNKRLYDGAQHASLQIIYKEKIYKSNSFDHDAPPKQIESLISYIVSLTETVE